MQGKLSYHMYIYICVTTQCFEMDKETGMPTDVHAYGMNAANQYVRVSFAFFLECVFWFVVFITLLSTE